MALINKLSAIGDAIREKTGKADKLSLDQMVTEIASIETGGGASGENVLAYATTFGAYTSVSFENGYAFEVTFGAKDGGLLAPQAFSGTFWNALGMKSIKINYEGTATTLGSMQNFLRANGADQLLELVDLTGAQSVLKPTTISRAFEQRQALKEILGEFDMTNCINLSGFTNCYALETIRFKEGTVKVALNLSACSKLTDATIQNIIDGLADLTGGTAQTLTLNATVKGKLTDTQVAAITNKNWNLA